MAGELFVRPADVADAGDVSRLMAQLGYEVSPAETAVRLPKILAKTDQRFLVAALAGAIVGWIHVSLSDHIDAETCVMIEGLVVDREHRRHGIGATLLRHAEDWGRSQGCSLIRLRSASTRTQAHKFYQDLGYTVVKTQLAFAKALAESARGTLGRLSPKVQD